MVLLSGALMFVEICTVCMLYNMYINRQFYLYIYLLVCMHEPVPEFLVGVVFRHQGMSPT